MSKTSTMIKNIRCEIPDGNIADDQDCFKYLGIPQGNGIQEEATRTLTRSKHQKARFLTCSPCCNEQVTLITYTHGPFPLELALTSLFHLHSFYPHTYSVLLQLTFIPFLSSPYLHLSGFSSIFCLLYDVICQCQTLLSTEILTCHHQLVHHYSEKEVTQG